MLKHVSGWPLVVRSEPKRERRMYNHLLIATDGSELAMRAVEQGLALAKALKTKVTAITVTEPWTAVAFGEVAVAVPAADYEAAAAESAATILAGVSKAATEAGVTCHVMHVKDQFPAEGIIKTAKARSCDLIVMASHGRRGLTRLLLGSQANKVMTHSTIPVLICR